MHRARLMLQASNKIGSTERFASWLIKKPQPAAMTVSANRLKSSTAAEPFLNGSSSAYVETMYNNWLTDPNSVHASWDAFFRNATNGAQPGVAYTPPPNLAPYSKNEVPLTSLVPAAGGMPSIASGSPINEKIIDDHLAVQAIIRSYQARGHLAADVDPLGIKTANLPQLGMRAPNSELIMRKYFNFGTQHTLASHEWLVLRNTRHRYIQTLKYDLHVFRPCRYVPPLQHCYRIKAMARFNDKIDLSLKKVD